MPPEQTPAPVQTQPVEPVEQALQDNDVTLKLVAFIFNVATTVLVAPFLLPLAWCIPMTVISYGIYKGTKRNTTAFAVCTLIFVNLVSGILLLLAKKED